jgi:hypothetical protein
LKNASVSTGHEDGDEEDDEEYILLGNARQDLLPAQGTLEYQQYIEIMSWICNIQEYYETNAKIEAEPVSQGINNLLSSMSKLSSQYCVSYFVKYN